MRKLVIPVLAALGFATGVLLSVPLFDDDDSVSVECAAAHVAAEVARHEFGTSTHGIPTRYTDEGRDRLFFEAYEHLEEACGGLNEPRNLWLLYGDLVNDRSLAAWTEHENPEWRPWYRYVICPTLDEVVGLCEDSDN